MEWRQSVAFEADESPAFVCPSSLLCQVALAACRQTEDEGSLVAPPRLEVPADLLRLQSPLPPFLFLPYSSCSPSPPGSPGVLIMSQSERSSKSRHSSTRNLLGGGALGLLLVVRDALSEFKQLKFEEHQHREEQCRLEQQKRDEGEESWMTIDTSLDDENSCSNDLGDDFGLDSGNDDNEGDTDQCWWVVPDSSSTSTSSLTRQVRAWCGQWWRWGSGLLRGLPGGDLAAACFGMSSSSSSSSLLSVAALLLLVRFRARINVHRGGDAS